MSDSERREYPLLEAILAIKNLPLRAIYTTRQVAEVFGVSPRALQNWIEQGKIVTRDLPGRARLLPSDIEDFLRNSRGPQK